MTTTAASERLRLHHDGHPEAITVLRHDADVTLVEVDLAPGGSVPMHVHRSYAEHFEILDGRLDIELSDGTVHLGPGEHLTAAANVPHRFVNASDAPVRFRVALRPGVRGFLEMQLVFFGLLADGRTRPDGSPRDPRHVAAAFAWADIAPAGAAPAAMMRVLAVVARLTGEERRLRRRYVEPVEERLRVLERRAA